MQHSHEKTTSHHCPACDYGHFTRNHYFTGKLLVERDFTDEQRYYVDKLRHHQQRLHGWGVVCGLKVKPHDNDGCRDRFVCVEPGSAVDCCGHDLIVREPECVDLRQFPEINQLEKDKNDDPHKLQICLRYRECPTEEIPVLYDECGCDDTQCAPNRILESHEFSIILDGKDDHELLHGPKLVLKDPISVRHAGAAVLHETTHRLYVTPVDAPGTIDQFSTDDHTKITSHTFPTAVVGLAVSKDGSRLYVVTAAPGAGQDTKFHVLKTEATLPTFSEMNRPNHWESGVQLEVATDGRLYGRVGNGDLVRFDADLDTNTGSAAPTTVINFAGVADFVLSKDGKHAFGVGGDKVQQVKDIDGNSATQAVIPVSPDLPADSQLLSVRTLDDDLLAVADQKHRRLYLIELGTTATVKGTANLTYSPLQIVASHNADWLYVEERQTEIDEEPHFVQAVSVRGMQKNPPHPPGRPLEVGFDSSGILINKSLNRLYVPVFTLLGPTPGAGGVVVIDIVEENCDEILWRDLEGCSHCDQPNCIVLATIENYRFGDKILDPVDLPDPADDQNNIARIDNRLGRRLLPSTQLLTEAIMCLLEHQAKGTVGPKGDNGEPGPAGGITDVNLTMVRCRVEESAEIVTQGNKTTLNLIIPTICDRDLAQITGINWQHASQMPVNNQQLTQDGLLIAFSHPVMPDDIHRESVQVLRRQANQQGVSVWNEIPGRILPIKFQLVGNVQTPFTLLPPETTANGIQFKPESPFNIGDYRVVVKGDFIRDTASKKAIDADHMPPWFGSNNYKTGDGVAGGTFESWFKLEG